MKFILFLGSSILLVLLMCSCGGGDGKGKTGTTENRWIKTYGGQFDDVGKSVQQTSDGGYIIVGSTSSFGAGSSDVSLIKTDAYGNVLWTKTYGGQSYDYGFSVQQTSDGGYIIAGATASFGDELLDVYLIKTDSNGNVIWSKIFYGEGCWDEGRSVQQTSDGGYIIAGTKIYMRGEGNSSIYLIKTDSDGNLLWENTFSGDGYSYSYSVRQTSDGGYIIVGTTIAWPVILRNNCYLLKTDSFGNLIWSKTFDLGDSEEGHAVLQTADSGYIVLGDTWDAIGFGRIYLIKTDIEGNTIWTKILGNAYCGIGDHALDETIDGGYIITGHSAGAWYRGVPRDNDVYLLKTDSYGNRLWEKTFIRLTEDYGYSVHHTADGGYIVVGRTDYYEKASEVLLIKTDSKGNAG